MQPPFHHLGTLTPSVFLALVKYCSSEVFPAPCLTSKVQELPEQCNYPSICSRLGAPGQRAGLPCGTKVKQQRWGSAGFANYLPGPGGSDGKVSAHKAGDPGLIPGSGRSPGEGNGNPLQYSYLANSMDEGTW